MTRLRHLYSVLRAVKSQCIAMPRSNLCIRKLNLADGQRMALQYFGVTNCSENSMKAKKTGL